LVIGNQRIAQELPLPIYTKESWPFRNQTTCTEVYSPSNTVSSD